MRRFYLKRVIDETGVSGVGVITEGVEFSDGSCVMRWMTDVSSVAIYKNAFELLKIHGHSGKTLFDHDLSDEAWYWENVNLRYILWVDNQSRS